MSKDLIIIGGGGHAKVVLDIAKANGYIVRGFLDDNNATADLMGYSRLGCVDQCIEHTDAVFVIAIGNNTVRRKILEKYPQLEYVALIHPSAVLGSNVQIGTGTVVMPGAIINACAKIGEFCVVNSGAIIEHDCHIGDFSLLAPHSTVCGMTEIGTDCWIGAGATIKNCITIANHVLLGVGAVVVKNITEPGTYIGVPAISIRKKQK